MTLLTHSINTWFENLPVTLHRHRGIFFGILLLLALAGFEIFNYSTTYVALHDLLGDLAFGPLEWATVLAIAFCSIDFAGIARLFLPDEEIAQNQGIWLLFGAWLLAATMNAVLTWWSVSLALVEHTPRASAFINPELLIQVVPLFIAILVWVTRILLIGTLTLAGQRVFANAPAAPARPQPQPMQRPRELRSAITPQRDSPVASPMPLRTAPSRSTGLQREPTYVDEDSQLESRPTTGARFL
ncbi:hypothetical protein [uncultured Thermanaerothrix sp.]|uniref:hypothetical protein n=1 Tax=uncultured Thermanaerothrix sp. TaxID=1195149 RepID=UPI002619721D|nr:hypothetical protein [uncultured Thermanaerothrix sp.]